MKWNRRQLSPLRTLYLICATLVHLPGAGEPRMLLLAVPWFICYVLSAECFHIVRVCAIGCSIAEFVMFALPMLRNRTGTALNVFCIYYPLIFLIIIIGTIFYWPAGKRASADR